MLADERLFVLALGRPAVGRLSDLPVESLDIKS